VAGRAAVQEEERNGGTRTLNVVKVNRATVDV